MRKLEEELAKLDAELERLKAERTSLNEKRAVLDKLVIESGNKIRALEARRQPLASKVLLVPLVGVPGGVKMRFRCSGKDSKLNDRTGTVKALNRTYADVDFGEGGKWDIPFADLIPSTEEQGERPRRGVFELLGLGAFGTE